MTTIIGVRAKNPETGKHYILLSSDSRYSIGSSIETDTESKLCSPKHSNYALASSGKNLLDYFKGDKEAEKILKKGGRLSQKELERKLWHIASVLKENKLSNSYLIAYQKDNEVMLLSYMLGQGLQQIETNSVIGSGSKYIGKSVHEQVQTYKVMNGDIEIAPKQLQELLLKELIEAAKKDFGTGGQAQFAIITHKSITIIENYADINYESKAFDENEIPGQHPMYRDID